jgi:hypothetical protein
MAAPEYVPRPKAEKARVYESPPWRAESWTATRPADLEAHQPTGPHLGYQGPDQGFMLKLARTFEGTLTLTEGEREADAIVGASAIAMRRASMYGRAPVIHDLRIALTIFGFLTPNPDPQLVVLRKRLFEECSGLHHYSDLRRVVDAVPESTLRLTPQQVTDAFTRDWRSLILPDA